MSTLQKLFKFIKNCEVTYLQKCVTSNKMRRTFIMFKDQILLILPFLGGRGRLLRNVKIRKQSYLSCFCFDQHFDSFISMSTGSC